MPQNTGGVDESGHRPFDLSHGQHQPEDQVSLVSANDTSDSLPHIDRRSFPEDVGDAEQFQNRIRLHHTSALHADLQEPHLIRNVSSYNIPRRPLPSSHPPPSSRPSKSQAYKSIRVGSVELHHLPDESRSISSKASENQSHEPPKEWIPIMLRIGPGFLMILSCWGLLTLLEVFDIIVRKRQGLSTENKSAVQSARYLPTVAVILLAFGWKALVGDLKLVTPYSAMSQKWAESQKSVLLDYIEPLEIKSVWTSWNNGHWTMFLGLFVGLLSGFLVPLANSLTYVNLYTPIHQQISLDQATQFSFKGALESDNNGSLTIPWNYTGYQPYAAVSSSRQPNGKNSPWTVDEYAFESFDIAPWSQLNASVTVMAQAFSPSFNCSRVDYEISADYTGILLTASDDSLDQANCQSTLSQTFRPPSNLTFASWLNVTDCSGNGTDIRMLATATNLLTNATVGLMCMMHYYGYAAAIQVNASTGSILSYNLLETTPQALDIATSLPVVLTYLNNPLDANSQAAYVISPLGFTTSQIPQATFANETQYATNYVENTGTDIFFQELFKSGRKAADYVSNPSVLETDMISLAKSTLAQVVNSWARANVSRPIGGSIIQYQPKLLVRASSLRSMQAILAFMGAAVALCCTIMRPRTILAEDPSNLAAVSVILSASGKPMENTLQQESMSDMATSKESLDGKWRLMSSTGSKIVIEADLLRGQIGDKFARSDSAREDLKLEGYSPFAFRSYSMITLVVSVCAVIIALAILLKFSRDSAGFAVPTSTDSAAWSLVPSTIIVLLGYALSSVQGVLRTLTPYLALRKSTGSGILRHSNNSSILLAPLHAVLRFGSVALAAGSIITLLFPAVKIVTAGLYVPTESYKVRAIQATVDASLIDMFEALYDQFDVKIGDGSPPSLEIASLIKEASNFVEWTTIPSFDVSQRAGALDNLVFSNLTELLSKNAPHDSPASIMSLRIPAIAVNITCSSLGSDDFETIVTDNSYAGTPGPPTSFTFTSQCKSKACNDTMLPQGFYGKLLSSWTVVDSNLISPRYQGNAAIGNDTDVAFLQPQTRYETPYLAILGEFANLNQTISNQTIIAPLSNTTISRKVEPGMFNVPILLTQRAASCTKSYWEIDVNATITRSLKSFVGGGTTILPWTVTAYERSSISYKSQYNNTMPAWAYPPFTPLTEHDGVDPPDSSIRGDILWPDLSKSTNVYELFAAYQQFKMQNLTGLLDPEQFASTVKNVWEAYAVQMLLELRPYALANATAANSQNFTGSISTPLTRMQQDTSATIAICVLLFSMLVGLGYIFLTFPREALMAKPPTTIAAQMALLAGSELLKRLQDAGVHSVSDTGVWKEKFRLGWWPVYGPNGEEEGWRWGIDMVRDGSPHS